MMEAMGSMKERMLRGAAPRSPAARAASDVRGVRSSRPVPERLSVSSFIPLNGRRSFSGLSSQMPLPPLARHSGENLLR
jgi:hypothetical protein